jgi:hypothetical protein
MSLRVGISDLNWDEITRDAATEDLIYVKGKIEQRLKQRPKRTILICGIQAD